ASGVECSERSWRSHSVTSKSEITLSLFQFHGRDSVMIDEPALSLRIDRPFHLLNYPVDIGCCRFHRGSQRVTSKRPKADGNQFGPLPGVWGGPFIVNHKQ